MTNWRIASEHLQLADDNIPVVNNEGDLLAKRAVFAVEAEFNQQFGRIAALCKNPEFREEDEWRLVKKGPFLTADKKEISPEEVQRNKSHSWFYKKAHGGGSLLDYLSHGTMMST